MLLKKSDRISSYSGCFEKKALLDLPQWPDVKCSLKTHELHMAELLIRRMNHPLVPGEFCSHLVLQRLSGSEPAKFV